MVDLYHGSAPLEAMEKYYRLASTLRESGIPQDDLPKLQKIWLQRRDIPATLYPYAYAAFIAGFTGQPRPEIDHAA